MWVGVVYCNQELFDKYNLEIPETYTDLVNVSKVFKENGVQAIGVGAEEKWVGMFYHNMLVQRTAGAKKANAALNKELPYTDKDIVSGVEKLQELVSLGVFNEGMMGMNYETVQSMFLEGQIAMFFQGDWVSGDCELDDSAVKGKIIATHFPYIEGKEQFKYDFLGGSVDSFMVSANTKYPKEAVMVLEYLAEELSSQGAVMGVNLPVYQADIDLSGLNRVTRQIVDLTRMQLVLPLPGIHSLWEKTPNFT